MTPEYVAVVAAFLGSGVLGALITSWFSRRKTGAESEKMRTEAADMLIARLSTTVAEQGNRISELEKSERRLQGELDELKHYVHQQGLPWPLMP